MDKGLHMQQGNYYILDQLSRLLGYFNSMITGVYKWCIEFTPSVVLVVSRSAEQYIFRPETKEHLEIKVLQERVVIIFV